MAEYRMDSKQYNKFIDNLEAEGYATFGNLVAYRDLEGTYGKMDIVREKEGEIDTDRTFGELRVYGGRRNPNKCIVSIPENAPPEVKACIPEGAKETDSAGRQGGTFTGFFSEERLRGIREGAKETDSAGRQGGTFTGFFSEERLRALPRANLRAGEIEEERLRPHPSRSSDAMVNEIMERLGPSYGLPIRKEDADAISKGTEQRYLDKEGYKSFRERIKASGYTVSRGGSIKNAEGYTAGFVDEAGKGGFSDIPQGGARLTLFDSGLKVAASGKTSEETAGKLRMKR